MVKTNKLISTITQKFQQIDWPKALRIGLILLPPLILLTLLVVLSVNAPFWDQWELVALLQKSANGTLGIRDFWAQHNEHRVLFPRLLIFALAKITHWNTRFDVATNFALGLASFGVLWQLLKNTALKLKWQLPFLTILVSWMFFSPIQWENWLWGWQISWFLSVLGLLVAVWALGSSSRPITTKRLGLAAAAAIVATYSLANGVFVWPIGLLALLFRKEDAKAVGAWLAASAVVLASYYYHYHNPGGLPSKALFIKEPQGFLQYVVAYLGRPLAVGLTDASVIGLALLLIFVASFGYLLFKNRKLLIGLTPWLMLALYGIIGAVVTAISRLGFGVIQVIQANRYTTISQLFIIATIVIGSVAIMEFYQGAPFRVSLGSIIIVGLSSLMFVLVLNNYINGTAQMMGQHAELKRVASCLHTARSVDDICLLHAYPNQDIVWPRLQYLRSIHYGGL